MTTYTPGPWTAEVVRYQDAMRVTAQSPSSSGRVTIAAAVHHHPDARLIAQAPAMVELLKRIAHIPCEQPNIGAHCDMVSDYTGKRCVFCSARAILRAIEGGE